MRSFKASARLPNSGRPFMSAAKGVTSGKLDPTTQLAFSKWIEIRECRLLPKSVLVTDLGRIRIDRDGRKWRVAAILSPLTPDVRRCREVPGERISALPHIANTSTFVAMETICDARGVTADPRRGNAVID